jgi:hypothetical protein
VPANFSSEEEIARSLRLRERAERLREDAYRAQAQSQAVVRYLRLQRELRETQRKNDSLSQSFAASM